MINCYVYCVQDEKTKEEVFLDHRVHSRLIGTRGRSIRKIMEKYKVEIKFPRESDPDPNIVVVTGNEDNVLEAIDHLKNLEEEYVSTFLSYLYIFF